MKKLSLFWRLYLSVSITMLVVAALLIVIMQTYLGYDGGRDFVDDVRIEVAPVLSRINRGLASEEWLSQYQQDSFFDIEIFPFTNSPAIPEKDEIGEYDGVLVYQLPDGRLRALIPIADGQRLIQVSDPVNVDEIYDGRGMSEEDYLENNAYSFLIALTLIAMGAIVFLISKALEKPIENLQTVQLQFANGHQDVRADEDLPSPVDGLAKNFNLMAAQIQTQIKDQSIMTHAIAHELRTPLTRMQMALGLLSGRLSEVGDEDKALLSDLENYVDEMGYLTNAVLTLGKVQQQSIDVDTELDADGFLQKRAQQFSRGDIQLELSLQSGAYINMLPMHFQLIADNLIKNACTYGHQCVRVSTLLQNDILILSVEDDGPGIPEQDRQDIFTAFSRIDDSRSRDTGGYGLGLAIVDSIVKRYQGEVIVADSQLGGARLECRLPTKV